MKKYGEANSLEETPNFFNMFLPQISENRLSEFIEAYKVEFNEELTRGEVEIVIKRLIPFYFVVSRPLPQGAMLEDDFASAA